MDFMDLEGLYHDLLTIDDKMIAIAMWYPYENDGAIEEALGRIMDELDNARKVVKKEMETKGITMGWAKKKWLRWSVS